MNVAELAYEQLKALPDPQVREVLDFIGYLKERSDRAEWANLMDAQAGALSDVWANPEDDVWNDV